MTFIVLTRNGNYNRKATVMFVNCESFVINFLLPVTLIKTKQEYYVVDVMMLM